MPLVKRITLLSTPRRPNDTHAVPTESAAGDDRPQRVLRDEESETATVRCLGLLYHVCRLYTIPCERFDGILDP